MAAIVCSKSRSAAFSALLALGTIAAAPIAMHHDAHAESTGSVQAKPALKLIVDRAKVVRIAKTADTLIVGNPAIVDATVQDGRTIVLTGRSFGITNLIVLDGDGNPIVDETVVVQGHETNTVRIYRQAIRQTMACDPICEPTMTIGDDNSTFSRALEQTQARNDLSDKASQ